MEQIVPWAELLTVLQPFYPQVGPQGGRPPYPLEVMLRTHLLQLWNSRSDQGTQDDLLDIIPFRAFSKIDALAQGQAPDATTILRFRHFLEQDTSWSSMTWRGRSLRWWSNWKQQGY